MVALAPVGAAGEDRRARGDARRVAGARPPVAVRRRAVDVPEAPVGEHQHQRAPVGPALVLEPRRVVHRAGREAAQEVLARGAVRAHVDTLVEHLPGVGRVERRAAVVALRRPPRVVVREATGVVAVRRVAGVAHLADDGAGLVAPRAPRGARARGALAPAPQLHAVAVGRDDEEAGDRGVVAHRRPLPHACARWRSRRARRSVTGCGRAEGGGTAGAGCSAARATKAKAADLTATSSRARGRRRGARGR